MRFGGMVFGLIVVVVGASLLFDNIDVSGDYPFSDYWPVILIALGFLGWIGKGLRPELGNMVLMSLGGILLTQNLSDEHSFGDLWPALAIAVGISIIFAPHNRKRKMKKKFKVQFNNRSEQGGPGRFESGSSQSKSSWDTHEFFSGTDRVVDGEYTGSTARVKLAGGSIDLTNATLPEDGAELELDIVLGGYKVKVPADWSIDMKVDINMGEISDNRREHGNDGEAGPTLTLGGRVFMGGVEISN
jgi:predicted membrane protein